MLRSELVLLKQQKNVFNEKKVLMTCNHTFVQRLVQTFRDCKWLHFLFEYVQGGELFSIIHTSQSDGMPDLQAKFYACGLILAVEYLHSKDIIHRDIKPENILIDRFGYPKLVDFGFAKIISGGKSYTLCGTPEYLSPEMVLSRGHAKGADYWAIGILLYEMIAGTTPFCDHHNMDQVAILQNIVTQEVEFNYKFRPDIKV
jgi:serine/threonine protein kinase